MIVRITDKEPAQRMHVALLALLDGHNLVVDDLRVDEVRFLKSEFGDQLKKSFGHIYLEV